MKAPRRCSWNRKKNGSPSSLRRSHGDLGGAGRYAAVSSSRRLSEAPRTLEPTRRERRTPGRDRDERIRATLTPLGERERPPALLIAAAVAALLAIGVLAGALSIHDLRRHGGSAPGGIFLTLVLAALAVGMYRRRYWAVLGFEALLAFQILVTSLALVIATTILTAALCLLSIGLGGWLFWKLVRVMGRMQAGERAEEEGGEQVASALESTGEESSRQGSDRPGRPLR
jgi:hypothetical protein